MTTEPTQPLDDIIEKNSRVYGLDIIAEHFPLSADGLKKIHRRIINVTGNLQGKQKSDAVVSDVRSRHERNPVSIYEAIIRLSQDFVVNPPITTIGGGNGHYHDQKPSASRYTDVRPNQFCRDLFFSHIDQKVLYQTQTEDLSASEPAFLVPIIPTALFLPVFAVGYGEASKLLPRNLQDICKLAIAYCESQATGEPFELSKHAVKLLPDFPTPTRILNVPHLLEQYKKGYHGERVLMEGVFDITPGKITIETIPYGTEPTIIQKLQAALSRVKRKRGASSVDVYIEANIIEPQDRATRVDIPLKPRANPFEVLEAIRRPIELIGSYVPNPNYVNTDSYIHRPSIVDLLNIWYRNRHQVLMATKRRQLASVHRRIQQTLAELVVAQHPDKVIPIIQKNELGEAITILQKEFNLTLWQATYLSKAPLHTLSKTSARELLEKKKSLEDEISAIYDTFKDIPLEMISHISDFAHKYSKVSRRTPESIEVLGYIGVLWFPELKGSIQVSSIDEVIHYYNTFGKTTIEWIPFTGPNKYSVNASNRYVPMDILSKIEARSVLGVPVEKELYTVNVRKDRTACVVKGFAVDKEKGSKTFYTASRSLMITSKGEIIRGKPKEYLSLRKTISTGARSDIVFAMPYSKGKTVYIALMSKKNTNTLQVYKIDDETKQLRFRYDPDLYCVDITPTSAKDQSTFFSIPDQKVLSRLTARGIYIKDVQQLLDNNPFVIVELATKSITRLGVKLIR